MRQSEWMLAVLMGVILGPAQLPAQKSSEQNVTVTVLNAHAEPAQPVKAVRVSLSYLDSAVRITDAQEVTNTQGEAILLVSPGVAERGDLRVEVTGAGDLVIYQPADGQLPALRTAVKVSLLPKGSPALLGPPQIEAMLHRTLLQVNALQKQVSTLKTQVAEAQNQKPDLGAALAEWAQTTGFPRDQVDRHVEQWAEDIQRRSGEATLEQKALAEVALKHFANAAQLFNQAADADNDALAAEEAAEKALVERERTDLRQLIGNRNQSASASQFNLDFHKATQTIESAEATARAEYKKHPDDKGFHEIWLQAVSSLATVRMQEGEVAPAEQSLPLLAQAVQGYQSMASEDAALGEPKQGAEAETGIGLALTAEALRVTGDQSTAFLEQAVTAYHKALEVQTKADEPRSWALTEADLGTALFNQAERAAGDKAASLSAASIQAFDHALEVFTRADAPNDWAKTQTELGTALALGSVRAEGPRAIDLMAQSVKAYRNALEIYTKTDRPNEWALAEIGLGAALNFQAERAGGPEATALFDQAAQAFQAALEVYTPSAMPQNWAATEVDLGYTFVNEGERANGEKSLTLLAQGEQSFRKALEVYTRDALPQQWVGVEINIGTVLVEQGMRTSPDKGIPLIEHGEQEYAKVLELLTKTVNPLDWARVQSNVGNALADEAGLTASPDKAFALYGQAVEAYNHALEVDTKAANPQDWARIQYNVGYLLEHEGQRNGGPKALDLLSQAIQSFQNALEIYTKASFPRNWMTAEVNIGDAFSMESQNTAGEQSDRLLAQAGDSYRAALEVATKADNPRDWVSTQLNLMEINFRLARVQDCRQQAGLLTEDVLAPPEIAIRDTFRLACAWEGGDKAGALDAEKTLSSRTAMLQPSFWDFTGTLGFVSRSDVFASGRASWIALFTSIQNGDGPGMTAALHQLEPILQQ